MHLVTWIIDHLLMHLFFFFIIYLMKKSRRGGSLSPLVNLLAVC